jgi:hypothetical protein
MPRLGLKPDLSCLNSHGISASTFSDSCSTRIASRSLPFFSGHWGVVPQRAPPTQTHWTVGTYVYIITNVSLYTATGAQLGSSWTIKASAPFASEENPGIWATKGQEWILEIVRQRAMKVEPFGWNSNQIWQSLVDLQISRSHHKRLIPQGLQHSSGKIEPSAWHVGCQCSSPDYMGSWEPKKSSKNCGF